MSLYGNAASFGHKYSTPTTFGFTTLTGGKKNDILKKERTYVLDFACDINIS